MRRASLVFLFGAVAVTSIAALTRARAQAAPDTSGDFAVIARVLQHPRCQNCHIPGDAPLQFDQGLPHAQNVRRGPKGEGAPGLPCSTCHATKNPPPSYGQHMPPGAPNWSLPPPEEKMVFIGLTAADLCSRIKDPQQNGGRDLEEMFRHIDQDKIVLWGWRPGLGRAPVDVPHAEFSAAFRRWIDAGAPCPSR
jgi:hypothetical protein